MSWHDPLDLDRCGRCAHPYDAADNPDDAACLFHPGRRLPAPPGDHGVWDCCGTRQAGCVKDYHSRDPFDRAAWKARADAVDAQTRARFPEVTTEAVGLARQRVRRWLFGSIEFDDPGYEAGARSLDVDVLERFDAAFLAASVVDRWYPPERRVDLTTLVSDTALSESLRAAYDAERASVR